MASPAATKYALGRNEVVTVTYLGVTRTICISEGSIDITTDTIEISNNCNAGWKIKLPGQSSGSMSATGYVATQAGPGPLTWRGNIVYVSFIAYDSDPVAQSSPMSFSGLAVCSQVRTSIDSNDALRVELTFDLTGAPDNTSYLQIAGNV